MSKEPKYEDCIVFRHEVTGRLSIRREGWGYDMLIGDVVNKSDFLCFVTSDGTSYEPGRVATWMRDGLGVVVRFVRE